MSTDIYKSATIKLTMWYLAIVVAISLIFSGAVYHFATNELAATLDTQSARIYRTFPVLYNNPLLRRSTDLQDGSRHILLRLAEFNVVVFVASGFASYWLARRTLQPIEESNERQKRFVADASHELRTPLTALKMNTEVALLNDTASKSDMRAALTSNLEEINQLDTLLNNLLQLSQLETADIRHRFTLLSTTSLINAAIEQATARATAKHITLQNDAQDKTLFGDHDSLVQLLVILLDNAIKYSPEKSTITLTSTHNAHDTTVTVNDQGIGIEPTALQHVFDRFYRTNKARSHNGSDGFGLGLSIAKHIVDLHQGTITLTSAVGKGTKATIHLPSAAPEKSTAV